MNILITGATGFIGNHLILELLKNSSNNIIATSKNIEKAKKFDWFNKVKYIEYDINSNLDVDLYDFFYRPDVLIHLSWEGLSSYNSLIHIENLFNHYSFIKNMVSNGLNEILITGTCLEYGLKNGCLNENIETNPSNSYAISKDSLRRFIIELKREFNFNYKWIRLFYMYGDGQSEKSLLSLLEKSINNNDNVFNMSGGEQLRDYLHISDVVKNIIIILKQKKYTNEIINCCAGEPISIRKIVEKHIKKYNSNIKLNFNYYDYPSYEPMAFWGDNKKLKLIKKVKNESN